MKFRNANDTITDSRLAQNEFWHRSNNNKWIICEHIHGIYHDTGKILAKQFPIHNITNDDTDSEEQEISPDTRDEPAPSAEDKRIAFELSAGRIKWSTNNGKFYCYLCNAEPNGWEIENIKKSTYACL